MDNKAYNFLRNYGFLFSLFFTIISSIISILSRDLIEIPILFSILTIDYALLPNPEENLK